MTSPNELPKVIDNTNGTLPVNNDQSAKFHDHVYGANGAGFNEAHAQALGKSAADMYLHPMPIEEDGIGKKLGEMLKCWRPSEPSESEKKDAIKKLDDQISPLIPKDEQQILRNMHEHLINGDTKGLAQDLATMQRTHPDRFKDMIAEMDKELTRNNAGVSMTVDSKGNVLVYKDFGSSALSINPKDGSTSVRPIHVQGDGTVVLEPGEVLKADPQKIAKEIGNEATRGVRGDNVIIGIRPLEGDPIEPWPKKPWKPEIPWEDPGFFPHKWPKPDSRWLLGPENGIDPKDLLLKHKLNGVELL